MEPTPRPPVYIPEIDSLRAIAVLSVVIYHAAENIAPGGFIGVDIFFVVSGFVIARSYLFDLLAERKRISHFFVARFRRLALPAFTVLIASSSAASVLLTPPDLLRYATSLIAQPFYIQNFVFWNEGDYFQSALAKPLLHTWSLAVEEQFYLMFALSIFLFRKHLRLMLFLFVLTAVASLAMGTLLEPRSPKTVFFMLPTRIWEFSIGITTLMIVRRWPNLIIPFPNTLTAIGMIWLVIAAIFFDKADAFPGVHSLSTSLVTAALLILFETRHGQLHAAFTSSILTHFGKISYGFYLWHWPPLSLFFLSFGRPASLFEAAALCVLAYGLTLTTVHLVETPVRMRRVFHSIRGLMTAVSATALCTLTLAWVIIASHGLILRYPKEVRPYFEAASELGNFRCSKIYILRNPGAEICPIYEAPDSDRALLLLGDSHANMVKEVLIDIARDAGVSLYLTARNCDLGEYALEAFCSNAVRNKVIEQALHVNVSGIIAMSRWTATRGTAEGFSDDVTAFIEAGSQIHFVETVPYDMSYNPASRALAFLAGEDLKTEGINQETLTEHLAPMRALVVPLQKQHGDRLNVFTPSDYLCAEICIYLVDGKPIYFDNDHLTLTGAQLLAPMFTEIIDATK